MYTITPILDKRRKLNSGFYPIKLRISYYRESYYIHLELNVPNRAWNSTAKRVRNVFPNYKLYNAKISKRHQEVESLILKADLEGRIQSLIDIKAVFNSSENPQEFISYGRYMVKIMMDAQRQGNALFYKQAIDKLEKYIDASTMSFIKLNHSFLRDWSISMKKEGIKQNSIAAYYRAIRAICNQVIKDDLMPQSWYPFKQFRIKTEATINRSLTIKQIRGLYKVIPKNQNEELAKDLFFLSFSLVGINFTDMAYLTISSMKNDRIVYKRKKTGKYYSLAVTEFSEKIVQKYNYSNKLKFVLPILNDSIQPKQQKSFIKQKLKTCNLNLKHLGIRCGISELTTYYSRYTWVYLAQSLGANKDLISLALGHSLNNSVTDTYMKKPDFSKVDELNLKILKLLK